MLMRRLGRLVIRHRKAVLLVTLLLLPIAGALGLSVEKHLSSGGFITKGSESAVAASHLEKGFETGPPNTLLLVTAKGGTVDASAMRDFGLSVERDLAAEDGVAEVISYWSAGSAAPLRGKGGTQAIILARIPGDENVVVQVSQRITPRFERDTDLATVRVGGIGGIYRAVSEQADKDLQKAEMISMPVVLVLLLLIFGSAVAAGLPLGLGIIAIVLTLAILRILTMFLEVSVFALNVTTAMGLGLAIDYSLFVVSRYREELAKDDNSETALLRTMHTAGRTVAFSAMSVAVSLAVLLIFPLPFLRSFAYAGVAVVTMAGIAAVVVLPAALAALGPRVNGWSIRKTKALEPDDHGFWYRQGHRVMRRPVLVSLGIGVILVGLGLPFFGVKLGLSDDRALSEGAPIRQVHDDLRRNFSANEAGAISVVASEVPAGATRAAAVRGYAAELSRLEGVARVDAKTGFYAGGAQVAPPTQLSNRFASDSGVWLSVVPSIEPLSEAGEDLVARVRDVDAPFDTEVGGVTASLVDTKTSLFSKLPLALILLAVSTYVLMFLMVGSLLVPLKSIVLNMFSLTATFGGLVWVFQQGHLSEILGFTPTGTIAVYIPIALFCVAFGLSQDYEVFLLARIKEHYDEHRDNEEAIAAGLQLSGRIITQLALLLIVVFLAFAVAEVVLVKIFGIGLALAIIVDAFIIRVTLAPALMRLAGHLNWWAPRSLRRLHLRYGIWEGEALEVLDIPEKANAKR